ncbi:VOC family protein [Shouchella shacheensis]|uniref:VOC family protein n=1 Tax=Shouchella shacheensis TaxID=1649580 RepID=UPI0007404F29|nr:VOC family protein [Shouchella shacheensis]
MKLAEIHHVSLVVHDLEKTKAFYSGKLQLPELKRPPFNFPGAWYAIGEQQLHLIEADTVTQQRKPNDRINSRQEHVAFRVESYEDTLVFLQQQDVPFIEKKNSKSGFRQIFCNDPDGNTLEFMTL